MAWTLLLAFVAMTLVFFWMLVVRYRIQVLSERLEGAELETALHERWAEGGPPPASADVAAPTAIGPDGDGRASGDEGAERVGTHGGGQRVELVP